MPLTPETELMEIQINEADRKSFTLWVLALAEGRLFSPVQLQKSVFLIAKKLPSSLLPSNFYQFEADNYGPFCGAIYDDVRALAAEGLASISPAAGNYPQYSATEEGVLQGKAFAERLPSEVVEYCRNLVRWVRAQSFNGLISAIYREYPEYKVNSIFQE
jgi:hypothetical protein